MDRSRIKKRLIGISVVSVLLAFTWYAHSGQGGIMQTIKGAVALPPDKQASVPVLEPTVRVVQATTRYQGGLFWIEARKDRIERFKCSQCHTDTPVQVEQAAHGDVVLDHGGEEKPLSCFTCHKEDERDYLETERGVKVDYDHSYDLCGQCHFRQKKDWVGGAHGKRISNWAGNRIVKSCTSCHDPHTPLFKKRWPKTYSPPFGK